MSTLSDAYQSFINTGSSSSRPGGDVINIQTTSGKKSNKTILEELQIAAAQREALESAATPTDAEAQRLQWEKEDQALQAAQDQRAAEADKRTAEAQALEQRLALESAAAAKREEALQKASTLQQMKLAKAADTRAASAAKQSTIAANLANTAAQKELYYKYTLPEQIQKGVSNQMAFQSGQPITSESVAAYKAMMSDPNVKQTGTYIPNVGYATQPMQFKGYSYGGWVPATPDTYKAPTTQNRYYGSGGWRAY